jgi:hypothetical protein
MDLVVRTDRGGDLSGHVNDLHVPALRCFDEAVKGSFSRATLALHQDPLGLTDKVAALNGTHQVETVRAEVVFRDERSWDGHVLPPHQQTAIRT